MIFEAERHCGLAGRHEGEGPPPEAPGAEVWVLQVEEGAAGLPGPEGTRLLPAGSLLAVKAAPPWPVTFPAGAARLCGAALSGGAAAQFAQQLAGPLGLAPGGCPEAGELLGRLMAEENALRQSAAGFALLCLLAAAPGRAAALPPLVAGALELIHNRYGEVYGVEELADELGVSRGHLIRSFSAALGQTPGRYLTVVRTEAAKRLLMQGVGLEAVAGLCGFSGANYFCRAFKKEVGQSPAAWQKQNAGGAPRQKPGAKEEEWEAALYL